MRQAPARASIRQEDALDRKSRKQYVLDSAGDGGVSLKMATIKEKVVGVVPA
jgi:hypothetical protein